MTEKASAAPEMAAAGARRLGGGGGGGGRPATPGADCRPRLDLDSDLSFMLFHVVFDCLLFHSK